MIPRGRETDRIFDHVDDVRPGRATPVLLLLGGLLGGLVVAVCLVFVIV